MDAYFDFFESHSHAIIRLFFGFLVAMDAIFVYAAVFDRDLPRRIAIRFFGTLSGRPVRIDRSSSKTPLANWLVFLFVSAVPPVAWIIFELYFA